MTIDIVSTMYSVQQMNEVSVDKGTILIVDDDDGLSALMERSLQAEGFQTAKTISCAEALNWLSCNKPDLMLLDHGLADMTGKEMVRQLAQSGRQVPFVVVTGHRDHKLAVEMMKSGAIDYVVKDLFLIQMLPSIVSRAVEQSRQKERLLQAERLLRVKDTAIAAFINAIVMTDLKGKLTYANDAFCRMWGYDAAEKIIGVSITDFLLDPEKGDFALQALYQHGGWVDEMKAQRKNGDVFDVQMSANLVFDELEQPACIISSFVDITERKQAEQRAESLAKFPSENPSPVLRIDRDKKILYANEAGLSLLGHWDCGIGDIVPVQWAKLVAEVFDSKKNKICDIVHGDRTFSIIVTSVADADYVNLYGLDVTEHRKAEEKILKLNRELEHRVTERTAKLTKAHKHLLQEV